MEIISKEVPRFEKRSKGFDEFCNIKFFDNFMLVDLEERDQIVKVQYEDICRIAINYFKRPYKEIQKSEKTPVKEESKKFQRMKAFDAEKAGYHTYHSLSMILKVDPNTITEFVKKNKKDYDMLLVGRPGVPTRFSLAVGKKIVEDYNLYKQLLREHRQARMRELRKKK